MRHHADPHDAVALRCRLGAPAATRFVDNVRASPLATIQPAGVQQAITTLTPGPTTVFNFAQTPFNGLGIWQGPSTIGKWMPCRARL
jgi:hypothetical protein